jgi:hypothetical protein
MSINEKETIDTENTRYQIQDVVGAFAIRLVRYCRCTGKMWVSVCLCVCSILGGTCPDYPEPHAPILVKQKPQSSDINCDGRHSGRKSKVTNKSFYIDALVWPNHGNRGVFQETTARYPAYFRVKRSGPHSDRCRRIHGCGGALPSPLANSPWLFFNVR